MKLTKETAEEIRRRYETGEANQATLAAEHGTSQSRISDIVRGVTFVGEVAALVVSNERPGWWDAAECRGVDPNVFYPFTDADVAAAKAICAQCPVRQACLDHALAHREDYGVWGGATERERRKMTRAPKRKRAGHGTRSLYAGGCRCPRCTAANAHYLRITRAVGA